MSDRGEPPVWDGEGTDPWLPARLAAIYDAVVAEARLFRAFLSFLREWMSLVRSRMEQARYDPTVIGALVPAWYDAMDAFSNDHLFPTMEQSYIDTVNAGLRPPTPVTRYPVDMAAAARARAYMRRNQLVRFPDELYALIQREVDRALSEGIAGPRLAEAIDTILDMAATPRWENRASVIARTESIGALNGGRADGQTQIANQLGGTWEKMWVATFDTRTRATHRIAEGQRVAVNGGLFAVGEGRLAYPGDPGGPPEEVIQCRCTTVLVRPGQTVDFSRRRS
jgi:hypothetical protein